MWISILNYCTRSLSVQSLLERDKNNFDLLRLLAALAVVFGHAFPLFPHTSGEPVESFLKFTYIGTLAVDLFFFLSGILITASFVYTRSVRQFLLKRVARLAPALIVCVALTTFIVGPLFSSLSLQQYLSAGATWHYLVANIVQYRFSYILPGVFTHNFYKDVVNGSLWTLGAEIRAYLFVLLTGALSMFRYRLFFLAVSLLLFCGAWLYPALLSRIFLDMERAYFFFFFLAGMNVFLFRAQIRINIVIALLLAILWLVYRREDDFFSRAIFFTAFLYFALWLSQSRLLRSVKLKADYSYGIYIYSFVVQQCFAAAYPAMTSYYSLIFVVPVVLLLAALSWHLVEKPALNFVKRKFPGRR